MKYIMYIVIFSTIGVFFQNCNSSEFTSAKVYLGQHDYVQAEEWFLKALKIESTNSEIPFMLGTHVYKEHRKWAEMNDMYTRSLEIDKRFETKIVGFRRMEWQNYYKRCADVYNKYIKSDEKESNKLLEAAIKAFETAKIIDPLEVETYGILATCYLLTDDIENAKINFLNAIERDTGDLANYKSLSSIYLNEENNEDALKIIQRAREIDTENAGLVQQMANIYYKTGQKQLALQTFQEALKLDPDNVDLAYNIGIMYYQDNDFINAAPWLEQSNEKSPNDLDIIKILINCYQKIEDSKKTETFARQALKIDPENRMIIMALYKSLLDQGQGNSKEVKALLEQLE